MAIQQCLEYLDKYNWRLVETEDTALSAKLLHQHRSKHIAAIASKLAADYFSLKHCSQYPYHEKQLYEVPDLRREEEVTDVEDANKASVNFHTDHSREACQGTHAYCRWRNKPQQIAEFPNTRIGF
jgi:prephenate dehydratase